ncbi:hypothetical protein [Mycetocola sp. 2940]|uniref:hypothetical protein n=1 Tax=Mycetocola sp. 2940 TaxID=3156452 RepID=UPI0033908449
MPRTRLARASVLGIVTVAALLLTGCAGGQSTAEACAVVQTTTQKAAEDFMESVSEFDGDHTATADATEKLAASFAVAHDKITNADVKKTIEAAEKALVAYAAEVRTAADDPDNVNPDSLTEVLGKTETALSEVSTACTS